MAYIKTIISFIRPVNSGNNSEREKGITNAGKKSVLLSSEDMMIRNLYALDIK